MANEQTVMITGASTGIGKACAVLLDKKGFRVFAGIRKDRDATALKQEGSSGLVPLKIDVTDTESVSNALMTVTKATDGHLHGLVNNAGVGGMTGPLEGAPLSEIKKVIEVNTVGLLMVTKAFLPLLRKSKGRIVNVGSMVGLLPIPGMTSYVASKFAVEGLSDSLRVEMSPLGVSVSIVEPGPTDTPMFEKGFAVHKDGLREFDPEIRRLYSPLIDYLQRKMENPEGIPPEKVAEAVLHALTAKRPKHRYPVGKECKIMAKIGLFPTRLTDLLLRRMIYSANPSRTETS